MARSETQARTPRLLVTAVAALGLGGCTQIDNTLAKVPFFAFMHESPHYDPYEMPRPAPPGAVPFQSPAGAPEPAVPAGAQGLDQFAAQIGANPYGVTGQTLARGEAMYDRYCSVCHGPTGQGNGSVITTAERPGRFPFAPNLNIPPASDRSDGYYYAIIKAGRGLMPAYGDRVPPQDRWMIVQYMRHLQQRTPGVMPDTAASPPWRVTLPQKTQAAPAAGTAQGAQ